MLVHEDSTLAEGALADPQAEHFDSKVRSLGSPLFSLALQNKILDLQHLIFLFLAGDMAIMDANSEVWGQVRPPSPRYAYAETHVHIALPVHAHASNMLFKPPEALAACAPQPPQNTPTQAAVDV